MKVLTKNVFYVKEPDKNARLWHTCSEYKKGVRGDFRVELNLDEETETVDEAVYACPHCDFSYILDKYLNLA